ncbi:MAG: hypothetical protein JKY67_14760 [Pseudomonadales bacterium]|nr:hypothetical protein [Pseudomonadales bacterium]
MFLLRCLRHVVVLCAVLCVVFGLVACKGSLKDTPIDDNGESVQLNRVGESNGSGSLIASASEFPVRPNQRKGVYLLMGQSNMVGAGNLDDLPEDFPVNGSHLFVLNDEGGLEFAEYPLQDAGVGPGVAFADAVYSEYPYLDIGLVSCAVGGSLIDQWYPDSSVDTFYGNCLQQIRVAMESAELLGVLWYQGESDSSSMELVQSWADKFKFMIKTLRTDVGISNLPISYAQLAIVDPETGWDEAFPMWDEMKMEQELMAAELQNDHVTMIRTDDLSIKSDGVHLDTASELEVGRRFATEMVYYLTSDFY